MSCFVLSLWSKQLVGFNLIVLRTNPCFIKMHRLSKIHTILISYLMSHGLMEAEILASSKMKRCLDYAYVPGM